MKKIIVLLFCLVALLPVSASAQDAQSLLDEGKIEEAKSLLLEDLSSTDSDAVAQALSGAFQIDLLKLDYASAQKHLDEFGAKLADDAFVESLHDGKKSGWFVVHQWEMSSLELKKGNDKSARLKLRKAATLCESQNVAPEWEAAINLELAHLYRSVDPGIARKAAEKSVELYSSVGNLIGEANAEVARAMLELDRQKISSAIEMIESAVITFQAAGDLVSVCEVKLNTIEHFVQAKSVEDAQYFIFSVESDLNDAGKPAELVQRYEELKKKLN